MGKWYATLKLTAILSAVGLLWVRVRDGVKSLWRQDSVRVAVVLVLVPGIVAAGVLYFDTQAQTQVEDPVYTKTAADGKFEFAGGQWTNKTVVVSENPNSSYLLQINLEKFAGNTTDIAYKRARQDNDEKLDSMCQPKKSKIGNGFIACFWVYNSTKGVKEPIRRSLLSDGEGMYYQVPQNGSGKLEFRVYSTHSGYVTLNRTTKIPDEISVRTHRKVATENCGDCHQASNGTVVHRDMGATTANHTDWKTGTCATCHDSTMTDLHQDCDNACHIGGYPIVADDGTVHDPNDPQNPGRVRGEYFCGSESTNCHNAGSDSGKGKVDYNGSIGAVHAWEYTKEKREGYCTQCHVQAQKGQYNQTMYALHSDYGAQDKGCHQCHGVSGSNKGEVIHAPAWNIGLDKDFCHQ